METLVAPATEEIVEDPPLLVAEPTTAAPIAVCMADCSRCVVQALAKRMAQPHGLSRFEAREFDQRFERQALGLRFAGDTYVRRLDQKEASLQEMEASVAGCDKIAGDTRMLTLSLIGDVRHLVAEEVRAERLLYMAPVGPLREGGLPPKVEEEPYTPPAPVTITQRLFREWDALMEKVKAYVG